jgi:hypothetical protein
MKLFEHLTDLIFLSIRIETLKIEEEEYAPLHHDILTKYHHLFEILAYEKIEWPLKMEDFETLGRIPHHKELTKAACKVTGKTEQNFVSQMMYQKTKKPSCNS